MTRGAKIGTVAVVMVRLLLWLRMVGFTALFVSMPLLYLSYRRRPFRWLRSYLSLLIAMAVFDLSFTVVLAVDLYAHGRVTGGHLPFFLLQAAVSLALLYLGPRMVQRLLGTPRGMRSRLLILAPLAVLMVIYVFVGTGREIPFAPQINAMFYLYLGGWFLWALLQRNRMEVGDWYRGIVAFLIGGVLWTVGSAVDWAFGPHLISRNPDLPLFFLTSAVFNILWAVAVIVPTVAQLNRADGQTAAGRVSDLFVREFGLSEREREVLDHLCRGRTNREIAEALYISPRTVENHVYNLYRKCAVGKRMELTALVQRYADG